MRATRHFPAVVLTGPGRADKTMLLRRLFPEASYFLLEDPDMVARLRADPHGFLDAVKTPAILDEVQNVPEVFAFVRARCPGRDFSMNWGRRPTNRMNRTGTITMNWNSTEGSRGSRGFFPVPSVTFS